MAYMSMVALVLWEPDYEDLKGLLKEQSLRSPEEIFKKIGTLETPDERYVCLYSDCIEWNSLGIKEIEVITEMMRSLRHSFIRIGDEIGDVEVNCDSTDYRGIDEEFECDNLIGINTEITGLEMFTGLEEFGISENGEITIGQIRKAEQCLIDNGIEPDEASSVLQAVGYILLDKELYPERSKNE